MVYPSISLPREHRNRITTSNSWSGIYAAFRFIRIHAWVVLGKLNNRFRGLLRDAALGRTATLVLAVRGDNVAGVPLQLDVVVGKLAELDVVDADVLLLGLDAQAQAGDQVHQEQDDAGQDERVREARDRVGELVCELDVVVVDPTAVDLGEAVKVGYVVTILGFALVSNILTFTYTAQQRTREY